MSQPEVAKNVLEALLEGTDYKDAITNEQRTKLSTLINETVEARVAAKEKLLTEEIEKKATTKLAELEAEKAKLLKESEENEKVLVEQAEKYKSELEEEVLKEVKTYKESAEKAITEKANKYRTDLEAVVLEEAKAYKDKQDKALVEEVRNFKGELIAKVSDFLEAKLETAVPTAIMEAQAKLEIYQPLVEGLRNVFSANFVKLDESSHKLIKESRDEIVRLEKELQEAAKKNVQLSKEKIEVEKKFKIEHLTEGLTEVQRSRAKTLLEGYDAKELETRFKAVRDIIIEGEQKTVVKTTPSTAPSASQKVEKLVEGEVKPTEKKPEVPATKPQQADAIVNMQVQKVLKEGVEVKPEGKKIEKLEESVNPMSSWAGKVTPRYSKG